jgi:hypothetical protein
VTAGVHPSVRAWFGAPPDEAYSPAVAAVTPENRRFDPAALLHLLDGRYADVRDEARLCAGGPVEAA